MLGGIATIALTISSVVNGVAASQHLNQPTAAAATATAVNESAQRLRVGAERKLLLSTSECSVEFTTCSSDLDCVHCTSDSEVNTTECLDVYPHDPAGTTSYFCHLIASTFCCALMYLSHVDAETCMTEGEPALDYWTCSLEDNGCSIEDMPCYGEAASFYFAPTPSPVSAVAEEGNSEAMTGDDGNSFEKVEAEERTSTAAGTIRAFDTSKAGLWVCGAASGLVAAVAAFAW